MAATRSLSTTSRKKKQQLPFYEVSEQAVSAKIITDARQSVRAVSTERPYTPAHHRNLFGAGGSQSRPPSAFSIGARHFLEESRPGTAAQRLPPIEKTVVEGTTAKKLRRSVKPTPPTPVQSFQDLSIFSTSPPLAQLSSVPTTHHTSPIPLSSLLSSEAQPTVSKRGTESRGQPSDTDVWGEGGASRDATSSNSGELELKQSQFSPLHSKRSLSADTVKRLLSGQLENIGSRVISAGNGRKDSLLQVEVKKRRPGERAGGGAGQETARKSSADLPFWKSEIAPLLQDLESTPYQDVEHLCTCCSSLWACLKGHGLLGRTGGVGGTKRRSAVLKTVFKLLDHKDPRLLLKVAKIIVAMQVMGKNLLNVCKLLFTLGKDEANDTLFEKETLTDYLVDALMLANLVKEQETMVYGLGVVKLLASSPVLREQMLATNVMTLIVSTLKVCCETCSTMRPNATERRNVLIQLTGALRSLSDAVSLREEFSASGIIPLLASVLADHISSADIVFNISRVLSKLTLDSTCLNAVLQCPALLPLFLQVISLHAHHVDIIVRMCFILGNVTAEDDQTRHALFFQHSSLSHLNPLFREYLQLQGEQITGSHTETEARPVTTSKLQDVLIKLVRLIANLSVHSEVGPRIAANEDTVHYLLMTLANLPLLEHQELVLNTLTALNNLSYYALSDSSIVQRQKEVANLMVNVMMVESNELLLECTRVCGNLSRYPDVRDILVSNKVDEIVVTLLDSGRREIVYSACGVLINILADSAYHENVAKNGGIQKLVEVLRDFGRGDWQLASLVCMTLWNFSEKLTSSLSCFGEGHTIQLIQLLTDYIEESFTPSPSSAEYTTSSWKNDFLPVAQALLNRMKAAHTSDLIPLRDHQTYH